MSHFPPQAPGAPPQRASPERASVRRGVAETKPSPASSLQPKTSPLYRACPCPKWIAAATRKQRRVSRGARRPLLTCAHPPPGRQHPGELARPPAAAVARRAFVATRTRPNAKGRRPVHTHNRRTARAPPPAHPATQTTHASSSRPNPPPSPTAADSPAP